MQVNASKDIGVKVTMDIEDLETMLFKAYQEGVSDVRKHMDMVSNEYQEQCFQDSVTLFDLDKLVRNNS